MVLDQITHWRRYAALHAGFPAAFAALAEVQTARMPVGKHAIDGDRLFLIVGRETGRGREAARLEAHRRYIDIQLTLAGHEEIGWLPLRDGISAAQIPATGSAAADVAIESDTPYDAGRDIVFFSALPDTWLALPPGRFAIFFPDDAHAPLAGLGEIIKVVAKVAVEW